MQSQCCDDTCNTALIEKSAVTPEWVATPFWADSYLFPLISMKTIASIIALLTDAWCKRALRTAGHCCSNSVLGVISSKVSKVMRILLVCQRYNVTEGVFCRCKRSMKNVDLEIEEQIVCCSQVRKVTGIFADESWLFVQLVFLSVVTCCELNSWR